MQSGHIVDLYLKLTRGQFYLTINTYCGYSTFGMGKSKIYNSKWKNSIWQIKINERKININYEYDRQTNRKN